MGRFPELQTSLNREFRNSYNEGIKKIDSSLDNVEVQSTQALTKANTAESLSSTAKNESLAAKNTSTQVKEQLNNLILENGDSTPEIVAMRTDPEGNTFSTAGERLDNVNVQLTDTTTNVGSIELFGGKADWNGLTGTENSPAFSGAFNTADTIYLFLPKGKFKTAPIQIPTDKNVVIQGMGKDLSEIYCTGRFFTCMNTALFTTTLTGALFEGYRTITLASTTGVAVGQLITLVSTQNMEETFRIVPKAHSAIITAISGNTVTLDRPVPCDFSITGYTVTVKGYKVGKVKIANCTVSGEFDGYFGDIMYSSGFETENVKTVNRHKKFQGETSTGGFDPLQTGGTMHGYRVMYSVDTKFIAPEFEYLSYGVMPSTGSVGTLIERPIARRSRHTAAPTGGSQAFTCRDGLAYECYAGYDSHECAYDSRHYNCHSYGDEIEVKLRGRYDISEGCSFSGGILTRHDPGLKVLAKREKFKKSVIRTVTERRAVFDDSISVKIDDCSFKEYVSNYKVIDMFSIEDTTITMLDGTLTTNWALWLASARINVFKNLKIFGVYRGVAQTSGSLSPNLHKALRVDRNDMSGTVLASNIEIDGFDYGIDFPVAMDLSKFTFENIQIKNCVNGINNAANYKDNGTFNGITFTGCKTNVIEHFRFRYTSITGENNQSFDRSCRVFDTNAMPTTGSWKIGDYGNNVSPTELGTVGSKYIVNGWKRLTTGSGNVLNTDWFEMRNLTGN